MKDYNQWQKKIKIVAKKKQSNPPKEEIAAAVDVDSEVFDEFTRRFGIQYVGNGNVKKRKFRRKDMNADEYAKYFEEEEMRKIIEVADLFPDNNKNYTAILSTVEA